MFGTPIFDISQVEMINQKLPLITIKPVVYLVNISKADFVAKKNKWLGKIAAWVQSHGGGCIIPFSIAFESELKAATDAGQRSEYLQGVLPATSSIPKMIRQVMECCCGDVFYIYLSTTRVRIYIHLADHSTGLPGLGTEIFLHCGSYGSALLDIPCR